VVKSIVTAIGTRYRKISLANYGRCENQGFYYAATAMEVALCTG
jgi:hypothetical protein